MLLQVAMQLLQCVEDHSQAGFLLFDQPRQFCLLDGDLDTWLLCRFASILRSALAGLAWGQPA